MSHVEVRWDICPIAYSSMEISGIYPIFNVHCHIYFICSLHAKLEFIVKESCTLGLLNVKISIQGDCTRISSSYLKIGLYDLLFRMD